MRSAPAPNGTALQTLGRKFAYFNGHTPEQSYGLYPTDGTSDGVSYGELGVAAFRHDEPLAHLAVGPQQCGRAGFGRGVDRQHAELRHPSFARRKACTSSSARVRRIGGRLLMN